MGTPEFAVPPLEAVAVACVVTLVVTQPDRPKGRGRVLVRPSGTEPLVRVMVEAPDEAECEEVLGRLVAVARDALG